MIPYLAALAVSVQPEMLPVKIMVDAFSRQSGANGGAIGGNDGSQICVDGGAAGLRLPSSVA